MEQFQKDRVAAPVEDNHEEARVRIALPNRRDRTLPQPMQGRETVAV